MKMTNILITANYSIFFDDIDHDNSNDDCHQCLSTISYQGL